MGSAASTYPLFIDLETFRSLSGDSFHPEIFDAFKNENGLLPREKFLELISVHLHVPQFEVAFSAYGMLRN